MGGERTRLVIINYAAAKNIKNKICQAGINSCPAWKSHMDALH
jgi:hypothetical protein